MAFSMHSHSGEFCPGHAKDSLEKIVLKAISKGMTTYALTEHMPRDSDDDLYPEEVEAGHQIADLLPRHNSYLQHACHLRSKYASQITLLVGFESELIRPSYIPLIHHLASAPELDFWLGSIHHVYTIPIDFSRSMYLQALKRAGTEEKLWEDYFDEQYEMIKLGPRVVGHFDLVRLLSEDQGGEGWRRKEGDGGWKGVWERVRRNLAMIVERRILMEVNTAGLRKGLGEPFPGRNVCEVFLKMGGNLTLSDDAHGVDQVGTHYEQAFEFLESLGVEKLWYLGHEGNSNERAPLRSISLKTVKGSFR